MIEAIGWTLCAGTVFVATADPISRLWEGIHTKLRGFRSRMRRVGLALGVGVAAIAVASQTIGRDPVAGFSYSAPNTPTGSVVVVDTSTVYFGGSAFVGSGDAAHDSTQFQIDTLNGGDFSAPIADSVTGPQIRDTIQANAAMDADSSYQARWRYKADPNKGGWSAWSAPDTFTNAVVVYSTFWKCSWDNGTGTGSAAIEGTSSNTIGDDCYREDQGTGALEVVTAASIAGECLGSWPTANVLRITHTNGANANHMVFADSVVAIPAVGESVFFRIYSCKAFNTGEYTNKHWQHFGTGSWKDSGVGCTGSNGCYSGRWFNGNGAVQADSTFQMAYGVMFGQDNVGRGQGSFNNDAFKARRIEVHEVRMNRFKTDSMWVDVRIKDTSGNLIADSGDFGCGTSDVGGCQGGDVLGAFPAYVADWRRLIGLEVGSNGANSSVGVTRYRYVAAAIVAVSADSTDWVGLYPAGEEIP